MPYGYGTLVAELNDALTRQRYNRVAVHNYCRNADYFLAYLTARAIALEEVTPADVTAYLRFAVRQFRKRHGRAPARYWIGIPRSGIHALLKLALKRWPPETAGINAGERLCREVCDQYQTWLREERGLATASIDALLWEARNFCAWLIKHSNAIFADLTVRDLDIYMDMRARGLTRKSLKDVAERLRSLLRHLHRTGRIAADLSQHVIAPLLYAYEGITPRSLFEATPADCQKIVVLRDTDRYMVELGVQHADWLRALQVSVRDYHLSHGAERALPIETFHAKLVVADDTLAYVGSANLLYSSEGLSLETGLLVEGAAATQAARLVDAVLRVARSL
jgi:hypothetical protein